MNTSQTSRQHARQKFHATALAAGVLAAAMSLAACGPQAGSPGAAGATAPTGAVQAPISAQGNSVPAQEPSTARAPMTAMQGPPTATNTIPAANQNGYPVPAPQARAAGYGPTATYPAPVNGTPQTYAQAQPYAQAQDEVAPPTRTAAPVAKAPVASARLGEVRSIEPIRERPQGNGTGAVIGGVLGAVVGNQFGHGGGRAVTTVLGAAGGAVAGNNVERNHREGIVGYRVNVRLDNGTSRTFQQTDASEFRVGDRVRVDRGQLRPV